MTRSDLKELIRECLIEILSEGAPATASPRMMQRPSSKLRESTAAKSAPVADVPRRKTIGGMSLDRPAIPEASQRSRAVQHAVSAASKITSDPVLASIFADTAATTLQEQASAENMRPGTAADPVSRVVAGREVHELFGDATQNWAALAFSDAVQR